MLTYVALGWLEYCNSDRNSYYANLRRKNGREKPYNVSDLHGSYASNDSTLHHLTLPPFFFPSTVTTSLPRNCTLTTPPPLIPTG
jgi:hypothetical protein